MSVSEMGKLFLSRLDDYSLGGRHVTPATDSYTDLKHRRVGIGNLDDWNRYEAIHLNPAEKSLQTAYHHLRIRERAPKSTDDRVLVMDFDNYTKAGRAKVDRVITIEKLIERADWEELPLPYCIIKSETPGNFHAIWVLAHALPRKFSAEILSTLYRQWGSDERFTNSTMRNPLFYEGQMEGNSSDKVLWWDQWAIEEPLLRYPADLLLTPAEGVKKYKAPERTPAHLMGKFKFRLTRTQLEDIMMESGIGDNRFLQLRSWGNHFVMENWDGQAITSRSLSRALNKANKLFKDPLETWRVREIVKYWTPYQQEGYIKRQYSAGKSYSHDRLHEDAVVKYFETKDMRDRLDAFLRGSEGSLTASEVSRLESFTERKQAPNKLPTRALIAYMLELETNSDGTSPVNQVRATLSNGALLGYDYEEYKEIVAKRAAIEVIEVVDPETGEVEEINALTGELLGSTVPDLTRTFTSSTIGGQAKVYEPVRRTFYEWSQQKELLFE